MKKGLLGSTALVAATAMSIGAAQAADPPTWKLSGYLNFLVYFVDQDVDLTVKSGTGTRKQDDATMFFEVNESEYNITSEGTTDNGLTYGLNLQLNAAANESSYSDEAFAFVKGGFGTIEFGSNDGAEDTMAVGAESIVGGVAGFDGEYFNVVDDGTGAAGGASPKLIGDTGDQNKITYYSPSFSGFRFGVSYTPNNPAGDGGRLTTNTASQFVDNIGVGAQFAGSVGGGVDLKVGAVYVTDTEANTPAQAEDASAWAVGGIVGFQNFQVAAGYGDNGDSHQAIGSGIEETWWDVGASFEQGPIYLSAAYFVYTVEDGPLEDELTVISLTGDYQIAPGLSVLAEVNLSESTDDGNPLGDNEATTIILGSKVRF